MRGPWLPQTVLVSFAKYSLLNHRCRKQVAEVYGWALDFPANDLSTGLVHSSHSGLAPLWGQETQNKGRETWRCNMVSLAHLMETQNNYHCCKWSLLCGLIVKQGVKTTTMTTRRKTNILTFLNRSPTWKKAASCRRGPRSHSVGTSKLPLYRLHVTVKSPIPFCPCWEKKSRFVYVFFTHRAYLAWFGYSWYKMVQDDPAGRLWAGPFRAASEMWTPSQLVAILTFSSVVENWSWRGHSLLLSPTWGLCRTCVRDENGTISGCWWHTRSLQCSLNILRSALDPYVPVSPWSWDLVGGSQVEPPVLVPGKESLHGRRLQCGTRFLSLPESVWPVEQKKVTIWATPGQPEFSAFGDWVEGAPVAIQINAFRQIQTLLQHPPQNCDTVRLTESRRRCRALST